MPVPPFSIGYLARIAPEKGLHVLAQAYIHLRRNTELRSATLEAAGYLAPEHRAYLHGVEKQIADAGFADQFRYHGELDRDSKMEFLRGLDVFSVPCTYDEEKGLPALEAMSAGVPVVQPRRGAFTEMVERTHGGILVKPDDPVSLAEGILRLWEDRDLAADLGRRGALGVREHYSAARMAARALEAYRIVAATPVHA
jgi:glycosyltransferase involved in cell wall biosynthesis